MSDAKMIVVRVPYDESDEKIVDRGTDVYWAVKPPTEEAQVYRRTEEERPSMEIPTDWRIMGSWDVTVSNKETIQGLRELLDRIEEELDA